LQAPERLALGWSQPEAEEEEEEEEVAGVATA
jgi:hypothetical protein